jgi:hypothetical protein
VRSEATMLAIFNANTNLGANTLGQGSVIAVNGTGTASLRGLWAAYARGLFWGLGDAIALILKRKAIAGTMPRPAMCWTDCSTQRHQRHERWMSGVVVDPGTVGVRW